MANGSSAAPVKRLEKPSIPVKIKTKKLNIIRNNTTQIKEIRRARQIERKSEMLAYLPAHVPEPRW
jgi:hypothetical protein